MTRTVQC